MVSSTRFSGCSTREPHLGPRPGVSVDRSMWSGCSGGIVGGSPRGQCSSVDPSLHNEPMIVPEGHGRGKLATCFRDPFHPTTASCNGGKCPEPVRSCAVAPQEESTEEWRRRRQQEIPAEVHDFVPERELQPDAKRFAECLRSALSRSSPGPGGCSNDICVCLDDTETLLLFTKAAEEFAHATVPWKFSRPALEKRDGSMFPFPTCTFYTRRRGSCGTCGASHHRRRPSCHGVVGRRDWCMRPCAPPFNGVQMVRSPRVARVVAVRQSFVRVTFALHMGGRPRTEARDSATRRRRTRRPFGAVAVWPGRPQQSDGGEGSVGRGSRSWTMCVVAQPGRTRFL